MARLGTRSYPEVSAAGRQARRTLRGSCGFRRAALRADCLGRAVQPVVSAASAARPGLRPITVEARYGFAPASAEAEAGTVTLVSENGAVFLRGTATRVVEDK